MLTKGHRTDCTPYLLSLGLTKGQTSLVWVAGPLSGLIVQPIIGVIADESTSKWGRRRPVIAMGSVIVACSLVALGFTKEIVASFVTDEHIGRALTIILAVMALYTVDFAINAGQIPPNPRLDHTVTLTVSYSHVLREKPGCRHAAHPQATDGCCLV